MSTSTAPPRAIPPTRPKLPDGLRWSNVWRGPDGGFVEGDQEVPVNTDWQIAAQLWLCPTEGCDTTEWLITAPEPDRRPCCRRHPVHLVQVAADPGERNPVTEARTRLRDKVAEILARRRQQVLDLAAARVQAAQQALADAGRRTAADMRGHVPSLLATGTAAAAGITLAATTNTALTAAVGVAVATAGAVLAYLAAYTVERLRARRAGVELIGRAGRRLRGRARQIAAAVIAAGAWIVLTGVLGVDPATIGGDVVLLAGCVAGWAANRRHWETLWATRRRLRDLARAKAEEAARRAAEEAARAAQPPPEPATAVVHEDTPEAMGRLMAARWADISCSATVPPGFLMSRTWIVPEETRAITVPIDGQVVRIGWEYAIACEPGALVARIGAVPPLVAAREWLAAVLGQDLELDPENVSLVDRPDGRVNRGLLLITDRAPLGSDVPWKGRDGVRVGRDGTIYVHVGRALLGEDVEEAAFTPDQPGGGLTVGHTGGGKTAGMILTFLNDLVAGIFDILYDPKQLVNYGDFIGIIPIGVTREHRDVILRSVIAERRRREQYLAARRGRDRHGRLRQELPVWSIKRDGPPIRHVWEEFHMEAADTTFVSALTEHKRLERTAAMMTELVTQGGGLADLNNSVLRGLTGLTRLRLYRMPDQQARLAGYTGTYMPSELPRLPGMCLTASAEAPPLPLRTAYVTREDVDGCVFDQLYAPDGTPLLTAPTLPAETVEVFEREGLMDLWRLGQGPDGMSKLLADANALPVPASAAPGTPAGAVASVPAADVVLAIVLTEPGCTRATIDDHAVWQSTPGWGKDKPPAPSTISRAASKLIADGLLTNERSRYRLTTQGLPRAAAAAHAVFGRQLTAPAGTVEPLTAAQVETAMEAAREQAEADHAMPRLGGE